MLHSASKISEFAAYLGIHRVSFARLARKSGVPGLVRTSTNRWRLENLAAFKEFVEQYKYTAQARCKQASAFQRDRERELAAAVRFHRERFSHDERIPKDCEKELRRINSGKIGKSYTTTELANRLGVTSQTIRNWRKKIPGARLIGQRLRFEKSDRLDAFLKARLLPPSAETAKGRRSRRKGVRSNQGVQLGLNFPESLGR